MRKFIIIISVMFLFKSSLFAKSLDYSKELKFIPSRGIASVPALGLEKARPKSLVSVEGHNFAIKPINKKALKSLDFLISIRVPLN